MARSLVVLAAGIGSRYGGLKQIDPVGPAGEMFIDYSIHDALAAGFDRIVFIIRKDIETAFRESIGARFESFAEVAYVFQELDKLPTGFAVPAGREKPWGTGHALLMAEEAVDGPFCVINADDFYGAAAFQTAARFLEEARDDAQARYGLVGFVLRNTLSEHGSVARGVCAVDEQGYLQSIEELTRVFNRDGQVYQENDDGSRRPLAGDEQVSTNMWAFTPSFFGHARDLFRVFLAEQGGALKSEFFIPSIVDELIRTGRASCRVLPTDSTWFGVTYREDKPSVVRSIQALIDAGVYPSPLWP